MRKKIEYSCIYLYMKLVKSKVLLYSTNVFYIGCAPCQQSQYICLVESGQYLLLHFILFIQSKMFYSSDTLLLFVVFTTYIVIIPKILKVIMTS